MPYLVDRSDNLWYGMFDSPEYLRSLTILYLTTLVVPDIERDIYLSILRFTFLGDLLLGTQKLTWMST